MKNFVLLISLLVTLASCAVRSPQASDIDADTQLGLAHEEQAEDAESALAEIQETQRREQKRALERVITETETGQV